MSDDNDILKELEAIANGASDAYTNSEEGYNVSIAKGIFNGMANEYADEPQYARFDILVPPSTVNMANEIPTIGDEIEVLDENLKYSDPIVIGSDIPECLKNSDNGHIERLCNFYVSKGRNVKAVLDYVDSTTIFSAYCAGRAKGVSLYVKGSRGKSIFMVGATGSLVLMTEHNGEIRSLYLTPDVSDNPMNTIKESDIFSEPEREIFAWFAEIAVVTAYITEKESCEKVRYWADGCTLRAVVTRGCFDDE